jgi:hypothetical protein
LRKAENAARRVGSADVVIEGRKFSGGAGRAPVPGGIENDRGMREKMPSRIPDL